MGQTVLQFVWTCCTVLPYKSASISRITRVCKYISAYLYIYKHSTHLWARMLCSGRHRRAWWQYKSSRNLRSYPHFHVTIQFVIIVTVVQVWVQGRRRYCGCVVLVVILFGRWSFVSIEFTACEVRLMQMLHISKGMVRAALARQPTQKHLCTQMPPLENMVHQDCTHKALRLAYYSTTVRWPTHYQDVRQGVSGTREHDVKVHCLKCTTAIPVLWAMATQ